MTPRAPKDLLRYLSYIATTLQKANAIERDNGSSTVLVSLDVSTVTLKHVHELGEALNRIALGANAREVFRQDERTKPNKTDQHKMMALAYWSVRALDPKAKDTDALAHARSVGGDETITDATLKDIAKKNRKTSLRQLAHMSQHPTFPGIRIAHGSETHLIENREPEQVAALAEYLRKKSPRPDVGE